MKKFILIKPAYGIKLRGLNSTLERGQGCHLCSPIQRNLDRLQVQEIPKNHQGRSPPPQEGRPFDSDTGVLRGSGAVPGKNVMEPLAYSQQYAQVVKTAKNISDGVNRHFSKGKDNYTFLSTH